MYAVQYPYQEGQGLGLASEWITGGFSTITNLIGGNQAKKQAERERENLLLQQQIAAQNNEAAWELEQLKFQNLSAQSQYNQANMNPGNSNLGNNTGLIVGGVILLAVGTAVVVSISRPKEKALNGLLGTIE
ncbi:MAG: hypothetical protein HWE07_14080 [Cytophagia bacterium]|nr:hypothetical protein [Cytophagia bacterium]